MGSWVQVTALFSAVLVIQPCFSGYIFYVLILCPVLISGFLHLSGVKFYGFVGRLFTQFLCDLGNVLGYPLFVLYFTWSAKSVRILLSVFFVVVFDFVFIVLFGGNLVKFYLLSDNLDTLLGMRLAGVDGTLARTEKEIKDGLVEVLKDNDVAIVLLTSKVVDMCKEHILNLKLTLKSPLLVEIPSGTDTGKCGESMAEYVHKTTGMNISF